MSAFHPFHVKRLVIELLLVPLHLYRRVVSPLLPPRCRYHPTCSSYAVQSLREYGVLRGSLLAAWRVVRCNPWSPGGIDPVAANRLFAPRHRPTARPAKH